LFGSLCYFYTRLLKLDKKINTPFFIASRIIAGKSSSISRPVVKIAALGITLGIVVMIVAISIVTGFQEEIRNKVIGFGSHIQVSSFNSSVTDQPRVLINQNFYNNLDTISEVKNISIFASKPGIIETKTEIEGVIVKGVSTDFNWDFFKDKMVMGQTLSLSDTATSNEILVSKTLATTLELELNQILTIYFSTSNNDDLKPRKFKIKGIYNTGLEEFDKKFIVADIKQIQKLNGWGLRAQISVDSCLNGNFFVRAQAYGGDGNFNYNWSTNNFNGTGPHIVCPKDIETLSVVVTDHSETLADTATINFLQTEFLDCSCNTGYTVSTTGGSDKYYTGGFEILLHSFDDLEKVDEIIYNSNLGFDLKTDTIKQQSPEIFNWLEMLDINVVIIIILMIFVAVINMASALLIIILERTQMIGILKSLGESNWQLRKIFLYNAAYLLGIGLFFGNFIGISLLFLQDKFGVVKLNATDYFVTKVPVSINFTHILLLNLGTIVVCLLALIIPTFLVTGITPVKAIKFD
jgi:lipoprotein-releasing system permease protein